MPGGVDPPRAAGDGRGDRRGASAPASTCWSRPAPAPASRWPTWRRRCSSTARWWSPPPRWRCSPSWSTTTCPGWPTRSSRCSGRRPTFAVLKGRHHYLCLAKLEHADEEEPATRCSTTPPPGRRPSGSARPAGSASRSSGCATGRRRPTPATATSSTRASTTRPGGRCRCRRASASARPRCPFGAECFAEASRARAREADIVVTNHSLLAVDMLAGRHIVPPHKLLVVDEAHELADRVSSAAQAELTAGAGRAGRPAGPAADRAGRCRGADRGRRRARPSGWPRRRPGRITAGLPPPLREACTLLDAATRRGARPRSATSRPTTPTRSASSRPRPSSTSCPTTAQRLLEESDYDVAWVEKSDRAAAGARWWWRRCRSPARCATTSTRSARWSPPRRRWRWAAGSTRSPGRSACRARRPAPGPAPHATTAPPVAGDGWTLARRRLAVRLPRSRASSTSPRTCPGPPRPACPTPPARSCSSWSSALGGRTLGLFSSRRAAQPGRRAAAGPHRPADPAAGRGVAAAAGPPVPGGAGELPVRRDVAVAGRRRARRRLPAGGDRPAAVPAPRRAAGRGPRRRRSTPPAAPASPR